VLGCAVALALHILSTGAFAPRTDPLRLTAVQLLTVAVLSALVAAFWERPLTLPTPSVWLAAAFTGLLASTFAFGAQTVAQRFTSATHTALIFVSEPVFAALFSYALGRETLTARAWLGCGLILAGMLAAELGPSLWAKRRRR
jgi:drug/metabolite transporter (DMT)-like permease